MPYHWRQHDGTFAAGFIIARHISLDLHEAEATHRGVEGWDEPVFYKGQICGHVRRYSDTLLLARKTWCGPLIATNLDGDRLTVSAPSESFREWLIEKHGEVLDDAARAAGLRLDWRLHA